MTDWTAKSDAIVTILDQPVTVDGAVVLTRGTEERALLSRCPVR
jgi:hypothetical protein